MGTRDVRAVLDTGPIIHLAEIDSLSLLDALDGIIIPETVLDELEAGGTPDRLRDTEFDVVAAEEHPGRFESLDDGEAAALTVADSVDAVLLTDDLEARERAEREETEVHGTVGIIVLAANRGRIDRDEAARRMRQLQSETSLFITDAVVERGVGMLDTDGH